ncbi:hypothetical protein PTSG_07530 [Salpingoeca rosetta]|uniref:Uncharacterized protein n=1 Tax=Salpingoeca rosetta (strain ATCC 50818 / BSB-021) TaxID=946362 RepID=F2UH12_SALR5|nr:uncharacterized protein PTSG_07530 [Salpingoeca rosetta]EGD76411.1 hypothetical protein PTSG_07530 [Salpingoeca rosetta]|eukprot:XP_004991326.1 hypothetical protein PTSG_07530 [Salpingoeca rosetta]
MSESTEDHSVRGLARALGGSIRFGPRPAQHQQKKKTEEHSPLEVDDDDDDATHSSSDQEPPAAAEHDEQQQHPHHHGSTEETSETRRVLAADSVETRAEEEAGGDDADSAVDKELVISSDTLPERHSIKKPAQSKGSLGDINIARELKINQRLAEKNMGPKKATTEFRLKHDKVCHSVRRKPESELDAKLSQRAKQYDESSPSSSSSSPSSSAQQNESELSSAFLKFKRNVQT